ncbi:APC family permease [Pedobacter namyangjuensis]|uniref:APC family permease n=1 Tax=Pedobacter namyangjuensis TaxID=600626 RepID=UPI000DE4411A|nr:amino acid permease [Pedobacter namyangjuensis]
MEDKKIGFLTACALVIANMVGTGVFSSLGFQVGSTPSPLVLLFLWLCGGLVALCGGLSYVELAKLYPQSGGEYSYIRDAYPRLIAYFAGLVSIIAGFAAPVALAAITFSSYFARFFPAIGQKWLALVIISQITLFHCFTISLASRFQLLTTAVKVISLLAFVFYGLGTPGMANSFMPDGSEVQMVTSRGFAVSLVYVSFAYSGWNACVYIFGEISNPSKNIARSIITGTLLVTLLYILLNFVFLKTVSMASLDGVLEVGAVSANVIFGSTGGKRMAMLIAVLLVSSISAMVWVGPRVMAKMMDWKRIDPYGDEKPSVPLRAIALQYAVTISLLLTETFQQILISAGVLLALCSCLSVAILFRPKNNVPKARLIAPSIFLLVNGYTILILLS